MYYLIMFISMTITIMFFFMNHPMSMGLILLIQTIMMTLILGMYSHSYWYSYILFLVMIGGMLILFIYMTSLASNEMFSFSSKLFIFISSMILIMMLTYFIVDLMITHPLFKNSNMMEMLYKIFNKNENINSLKMIYNLPNNYITILLVNYLFLTLIAVVKITNINYGPLRQKF